LAWIWRLEVYQGSEHCTSFSCSLSLGHPLASVFSRPSVCCCGPYLLVLVSRAACPFVEMNLIDLAQILVGSRDLRGGAMTLREMRLCARKLSEVDEGNRRFWVCHQLPASCSDIHSSAGERRLLSPFSAPAQNESARRYRFCTVVPSWKSELSTNRMNSVTLVEVNSWMPINDCTITQPIRSSKEKGDDLSMTYSFRIPNEIAWDFMAHLLGFHI